MLETRLRGNCATVNASISIKEVHGVEADDGQLIGNNLNLEPSTKSEGVSLFLRDKTMPYAAISLQPLVWSGIEDVVRQKIVVAKSWDNRDGKGSVIRKCLDNLFGDVSVHIQNMARASWQLLVAIVARRVTRPYNKVDIILDVLPYPF
jgi:hypothetical protein